MPLGYREYKGKEKSISETMLLVHIFSSQTLIGWYYRYFKFITVLDWAGRSQYKNRIWAGVNSTYVFRKTEDAIYKGSEVGPE